MSLLGLHLGAAAVAAVATAPDGRLLATGRAELDVPVDPARPEVAEVAAEAIWQATLRAVRPVLDRVATSPPTGLGVTGRHDTLVLWDAETLGSPRPAFTGADRRTQGRCAGLTAVEQDELVRLTGRRVDASMPGPRLAWMAEHEPRTWALVESGRYAVGTGASYLVARMTRGLWHVADATIAAATGLADPGGGWSPEALERHGLSGLLVGRAGEALPELVTSWGALGRTDRAVLGLGVPLTALVDEATAVAAGPIDTVGQDSLTTPAGALGAAYLAGLGAGLAPGRATWAT